VVFADTKQGLIDDLPQTLAIGQREIEKLNQAG
jgi:hypothetical protein